MIKLNFTNQKQLKIKRNSVKDKPKTKEERYKLIKESLSITSFRKFSGIKRSKSRSGVMKIRGSFNKQRKLYERV